MALNVHKARATGRLSSSKKTISVFFLRRMFSMASCSSACRSTPESIRAAWGSSSTFSVVASTTPSGVSALAIVSDTGHDRYADLIVEAAIFVTSANSSPLLIGRGQQPAASYFISSQFRDDGMNMLVAFASGPGHPGRGRGEPRCQPHGNCYQRDRRVQEVQERWARIQRVTTGHGGDHFHRIIGDRGQPAAAMRQGSQCVQGRRAATPVCAARHSAQQVGTAR